MTGNHFTSSDSVAWFRWISIKPYGTGHFLNGVTIIGNVFKAFDGPELQRVEAVDDSIAPLLPEKFRNVTIDSNTFNGVADTFMNPVTLQVERTSLSSGWRTGIGAFLPFESKARFGTAIVPNTPIRNGPNQIIYSQPYFTGETGPTGKSFDIDWGQGVTGKVRATVRCDDTK